MVDLISARPVDVTHVSSVVSCYSGRKSLGGMWNAILKNSPTRPIQLLIFSLEESDKITKKR